MSIWIVEDMLRAGAGVLAVPVGVVVAQTVAAVVVAGNGKGAGGGEMEAKRGRVVVLIPAHEEETAIGRTVAGVRAQLVAEDRVVVVADNCRDATAQRAREAGAEVVERVDAKLRGKGYALAAGVDYLKPHPPAVVVVLDADMVLGEGSIGALVHDVNARGLPMQAIDLLAAPTSPGTRTQLSAFAFAFKNLVRATGAEALGMPCMLRGTGMAFPWPVIRDAKLATGNIVEDMQLGVDLAIAGSGARLCGGAQVTGTLPDRTSAGRVQRTRWEHGHLQTIADNVPRLLWQGIRQGRPSLWALALDLAVPPLALLVLAWVVMMGITAVAVWMGAASVVPLVVLAAVGGALAGSVLVGWATFAREILPLSSLLAVPFYIVWKIPLYVAFLVKREKRWIRTERVP